MNITQWVGSAILTLSCFALAAQQPGPAPYSQTAPASAPAQSGTPASTNAAAPLNPQQVPSSVPLPAAPATPGAAAPGIDNARYIIGSEDTLQITVWREPTLSGALPVRPDGMISMVLLGDLPAAGMTPMRLSDDISQRLKKFFQDPPSVTVQVMAVNSQRIYMIGEVGHVGPIALSSGMTPLQAIATAGGLSPFANSKHIYILRGAAPNQQKIPFNYKQALKGDNRQQIALRPGDTIVVP